MDALQNLCILMLCFPGAIIAGVLGIIINFLFISLIAISKSPYMLFKGWYRLFHDCIAREGPFQEIFCVPFAFLAIITWPLAVAGAVLLSMVTSIFLGGYAALVVYQEYSLWMGIRYIVASISIYDEYINDILGMPRGSFIPKPNYRKNTESSLHSSSHTSLSSIKVTMAQPNSVEFLDCLIKGCRYHGEEMVSHGVITVEDVMDNSNLIMRTGLPAYSLLQILVQSPKGNCVGIKLNEDLNEVTSTNGAKDVFWDGFLKPLLIIKEQIKAANLSEDEADYLDKVVLLSGDNERMKKYTTPKSKQKRAELDAFARRLRGITNSISRYPTFKGRFDESMKNISQDLFKNREK